MIGAGVRFAVPPQLRRALRERGLAILELGLSGPAITPELRRRIRILSIATAAMLSLGAASIVHFYALGMGGRCVVLGVAMAAAFANLVSLRRTLDPQQCGHRGLLILAALLAYTSATSGGFYDPNFAWCYLLPITAAVLLDVRGAALWTGLTVALVVGFWCLPELGIAVVNRVPPEARHATGLFNRVSAVVGIGLMAASFVVGQRRALAELARANEDLSRESAYSRLIEYAAVCANEATSFEHAVRDSVAHICATMDWAFGHICSVSEDGAIVSTGDIHCVGGRFDALSQFSAEVRFRSGEGLPGHVAATGRPERHNDLGAPYHRERAKIAARAGLRSALAVPVFVNGKVRAVLEFASMRPLPDDDRLLDVFAHIGVQLGRVAERTALQDRLRQSQKMEAVGQLAAGLAHEINNPMSYVQSNLNRLREEWGQVRGALEKADAPQAGESVATCEELIGDCLEGIERTVGIVREVQEFSHVGAARGEVDLVGVVDSALRVATPRAGEGVAFERDVRPIRGLVGSTNQIRQVLVNLIVNAIHAVGEDGRIRISTARSGADAVIRVEDDGPGIAPDVRERLFEPFYTTKPVGVGTGLGLYISYEIAKNHGGAIRVDSTLGAGASFEVRLPLAT